MDDLIINAALRIPASDLTWTSVRSSGPGGQHVNKVATKVELRFDLAGTRTLDPAAKARLWQLAKYRIASDGALIITSQVSRSREQNLADARGKLVALVRKALHVPKRRRATKPTAASKRKRLDEKRRASERKRTRRRVSDRE